MSQIKTKFYTDNSVTNAKLALATAGTVLTGQGASTVSYSATPILGVNGTTDGTLALANGSASGASVVFQNLGTTTTWNFNLPISAGSAGQVLTSQGGVSTSMTWTSVLTNPMTTAGDIVYENATPTPDRLPIGTTGQVLTVVSGLPAWTAPTSLTSLGIRSGKTAITIGTTSQAVTFSTSMGTIGYSVTANMLNVTDSTPQFQPITITAQSNTGFTAKWNSPTVTANYVLSWNAILDN